jgi:ATP-dependent DNA helicase RecQ
MKQQACEQPGSADQSALYQPQESAEPDIITSTARSRFGIPALFPFQRLVISNILEGSGYFGPEIAEESFHRQIVILPTGSGKSLCFMLPGALLEGITLIVFPLLSLIADQARRLEEAGLSCAVIRGGQSKEERRKLFSSAIRGEFVFILTNPEILQQEGLRKKLAVLPIVHAVIDEAHTVSEWGTTFRPSYLGVGKAIRELGTRQITSFTATAAPEAIADITSYVFNGEGAHLIRGNPDRPNISYRVVPSLSKIHDLARLIDPQSGMQRPLIVFCGTRLTTERIAVELRLRLQDSRIRYYHAGLPKEERKEIEQWFFHSEDGVLLATTAYGMGVDKAGIRSVIHYHLSSSAEAYLQETGRAGRDTKPSQAILLLGAEEVSHQRSAAGDSGGASGSRNSERQGNRRKKVLLQVFTSGSVCRRKALLEMLDAEPEVCFGCDICNGTRQLFAEGEREIINLVRRHQLIHTINDAAAILEGRFSLAVRRDKLYRFKEFGALSGWKQDDIRRALYSLVSAGVLQFARRGPWKQLLRTAGYPFTRRNRKPSSLLEAAAAQLTND